MGDLRTMLAEVGKVYEGQIVAKDAALAAKEQVIGIQTETIAELRRRAAQAAAERDRLAAVQAVPEVPGTTEARASDSPALRRRRAAGRA